MKLRIKSLSAFLALFLMVVAAGAQEVTGVLEPMQSHPEGDAAISRLRSPYCPGLMLEVCPSPQAKMLRDSLQAMAHAGAPADSIIAWMLATHGEEYRAVPEARGSGLLAWLVPPAGLLGGLLLVLVVLKHFKKREEPEATPSQPISEEDESILAEALQELKAAEEVPF
ncbi:MAG: cytochrome c-type biogenesis protein CcmH [Gemmatimonadota bacterium]